VESQGKNKGVRYFPVIMKENRQVNSIDDNHSSFIFTSENQNIIDQIYQPLIKRELGLKRYRTVAERLNLLI
jgi:hypothetical protein